MSGQLTNCAQSMLKCRKPRLQLTPASMTHRVPSLSLDGGASNADLGGFDHGNIIADHVDRLEQLATV